MKNNKKKKLFDVCEFALIVLGILSMLFGILCGIFAIVSENNKSQTASADSSSPTVEYIDSVQLSAQPSLFSSSYFYKMNRSGSIERNLFPNLTLVLQKTDIPSDTKILFIYYVPNYGNPGYPKMFEVSAYYFNSPAQHVFVFEFYMANDYIRYTFDTSTWEYTLSSNWVDLTESSLDLYFSFYYSSYASWGVNAQYVPYLLTLLSSSDLYDAGLNDAPYTSDDLRQSYDSGVAYGYALGYSNGSSTAPAYQKGFEAGVKVGQSQSGDGNASLLGLMSAVVDAPIQAFSGLMNFKIFDIDLAPFLLSLFTVCIIISVVRIFI